MKRLIAIVISIILFGQAAYAATAITTRAAKGQPLTWPEIDANFVALRDVLDGYITSANNALAALQAGQQGGTIGFPTVADMTLGYAAGTVAMVTNDSDQTNNVPWIKSGAAGSGSWTKSNLAPVLPVFDSRKYTTLESAGTAIGNTVPAVLELSTGLTVTSNYAVTSNILIRQDFGGTINVGSGYTLTLPYFRPERRQIFTGDGNVKFTAATQWYDHTQAAGATVVYPEMWGTTANAVQKAAYSIASQTAGTTTPTYMGGVVDLANTHYAVTDTFVIPDLVTVTGPKIMSYQATIVATAPWADASHPVVQLGRPLGTQYWSTGSVIKNCTVDASRLANVGVYSKSANEGTCAEGLIIRNARQKAAWYQDTYSGTGDPRMMHACMRDLMIIFPINDYPADYPNPDTDVIGVYVSGPRTSVSTVSMNTDISRITVTSGGPSGVTKYKAGIMVEGHTLTDIHNSHAEYATAGIQIGDTYPAFGVHVDSFDSHPYNTYGVRIAHNSTVGVDLQNIYGAGNTHTVYDTRTSQTADITDNIITKYSDNKWYLFSSASQNPNFHLSRSRSGTYTPPAGTTMLLEHTGTGGTPTLMLTGAAGQSASTAASIKMGYEGGTVYTALSLYNDNIMIDGYGAGRRVGVPATSTTAGKPGQFAASSSYIYVYTGDGTTHSWVRSSAASW